MPARTLLFHDMNLVPFRSEVERRLGIAFARLIISGDLRLDFSGTGSAADFNLYFQASYQWDSITRTGHWYRPRTVGASGHVFLDALRRRNYCHDVGNADSCEPLVREIPTELGESIIYTTAHEAAHVLGIDEGGTDGAGHSGDPGNYMFVNNQQAGYRTFFADSQCSIRHRMEPGETLRRIAHRIGMRPPQWNADTLLDYRGADGRTNRDILGHGDTQREQPGTEIWIPDVDARLAHMRALEIQPKQFTPMQIEAMRSRIRGGGAGLLQMGPQP